VAKLVENYFMKIKMFLSYSFVLYKGLPLFYSIIAFENTGASGIVLML
jgi:hypothetical protein